MVSLGKDDFRRSIYVQVRRKTPLTVLDTFDEPTMSPNCEARNCTTVAPQSLLLMNDTFVLDAARALAARLRAKCRAMPRGQITKAWRILFGKAAAGRTTCCASLALSRRADRSRPRSEQTHTQPAEGRAARPIRNSTPSPAFARCSSARTASSISNSARPMNSSHLCSRRHFLHANGFGLGSLALAWLLRQDGLLAGPVKPHVDGPPRYDLLPKAPHFEPKAKAMISLFMMGGPSQMDLFDPKPMLTKYRRAEVSRRNQVRQPRAGLGQGLRLAVWKFSPHGQCGMELSELLPHLWRNRGRHHAHPLHAFRREQSRAGPLRDQ